MHLADIMVSMGLALEEEGTDIQLSWREWTALSFVKVLTPGSGYTMGPVVCFGGAWRFAGSVATPADVVGGELILNSGGGTVGLSLVDVNGDEVGPAVLDGALGLAVGRQVKIASVAVPTRFARFGITAVRTPSGGAPLEADLSLILDSGGFRNALAATGEDVLLSVSTDGGATFREGSGARATATIGGGQVTGVNVTANGEGYAPAPQVYLTASPEASVPGTALAQLYVDDPVTRSRVGKNVVRTKTVRGFLHDPQISTAAVRSFNEVAVGDKIVDLPADVVIDGLENLVWTINGQAFVTKPISELLAACWDTTMRGQKLMRTVLLRRAT